MVDLVSVSALFTSAKLRVASGTLTVGTQT